MAGRKTVGGPLSLAETPPPSATILACKCSISADVAGVFAGLGSVDPGQRGPSVRSRPASRSVAVERDRLVGDHAAALEPRAVGRDEIAVGVNQHVAVRQRDRTAPEAPAPSTSGRTRARARLTACRRRSIPRRCRSSRQRGSRPVRRTARRALRPHSPAGGSRRTGTPLSRVFITPSGLRSATKCPEIPIIIAASPPGFPRRSMMMPSAWRNSSTAC